MKTLLLLSLISSHAYAASSKDKIPAEIFAEFAQTCHTEVTSVISDKLAEATRKSKPDTKEEKVAVKNLKKFNDEIDSLSKIKKYCKEKTTNDEDKFLCHYSKFSSAVKKVAQDYKAWKELNNVKECGYISAQGRKF